LAQFWWAATVKIDRVSQYTPTTYLQSGGDVNANTKKLTHCQFPTISVELLVLGYSLTSFG